MAILADRVETDPDGFQIDIPSERICHGDGLLEGLFDDETDLPEGPPWTERQYIDALKADLRVIAACMERTG